MAIEQARSGVSYTCFGCQAPMVARQGSQRAWHFAHKPPLRGCDDPDRALHETAKALIVQGFTEAQTQNAEYRVGFACGDCGGERLLEHRPSNGEHCCGAKHRRGNAF